MKSAEDDRDPDRNHGKENQRDQIARENIRPKTNRKREEPGEVTDQFDRQHQPCQGNPRHYGHAFHGRAEKMQKILEPGMLETLQVVINECADGASQRHHRNSCGRVKARDQPDQIADQDEDKENREKGNVGLDVVSDDFVALPQHESFNAFKAVLQSAGRFHRKP